MQRDNPEMLALNIAIAEAAERSHKITQLQTKGLLDADISAAKLRDIEAELEELRKKRRNLLRNEQVEMQAEAFRQTVQVLQAGPEKLEQFDVTLFLDMVENIIADSETRVRFRLCSLFTILRVKWGTPKIRIRSKITSNVQPPNNAIP